MKVQMTIQEMVAKSYDAADEMSTFMDGHNEDFEVEQAKAYAHFGVAYDDSYKPTTHLLSKEDFRELEAQAMLFLLLKKAEADNAASFVYERSPKLKVIE